MTTKFFAIAALLFVALSASAQTPSTATATQPSVNAPLKIGGDVLPPKLIHSVEPKYPRPIFHKPKPSEVLVGLIVSADGFPTNIHIVKSGGADFDKSALNAVRQYRFQPSTLHGNPVPVTINIEVEFRIFKK